MPAIRTWLSSFACVGSGRWISMSCSPCSSMAGLNFSPSTLNSEAPIALNTGTTPKLGSTLRFFS